MAQAPRLPKPVSRNNYGTDPGGHLNKRGPIEGVHYPKGGTPPTQKEWRDYVDKTRGREPRKVSGTAPAPVSRMNQLGAMEAFVHRLVAAGHEVHIQAKPINQPRRKS